jgi:methionyl-tRNA synthetase
MMREGDDPFRPARRAGRRDRRAARPRAPAGSPLDLARATLPPNCADAPRERQLRVIEAHGELVAACAQAPTYNFDPGLLIDGNWRVAGLAAMPREAAFLQFFTESPCAPPMAEPYYLTTAISYPNGKPHIGHAYEAIAADVIARFQRAMGRDVRFQTGTDEHGLKMAQKARELGITPANSWRRKCRNISLICAKLNVSYDVFCAPPNRAITRAVQELWQRMEANGDLYLDRYEGWYSVRDEAYYDESELVAGEGGEKLSPQGTPVEWTVEESWFFRLSKYADRCSRSTTTARFHPPESRRNEVMRFVEGGLRDLSVSRTSFDWGVKVPGQRKPRHVRLGRCPDQLPDRPRFSRRQGDSRKYWPADLHLIGKDITRFHTVYWPAFLMSAGLPLPKQVFGHGFLLNRGQKESKSLGNVTDPMALAERFGVDPLRYFLMREVASGRTAPIRPKPSSPAAMPNWPTASATWRSAFCR